MQPTPEQVKNLLQNLNAQIPNPYERYKAYPAKNPFTGEELLVRRSFSVGDKRPFLHIYAKCTRVVKTPTGEVISREPSQRHYRGDLRKYTIEEV